MSDPSYWLSASVLTITSAPSFRPASSPAWKAAARPLLFVSRTMWSTPCSRATSIVRSVEPSSMISHSTVSNPAICAGEAAERHRKLVLLVETGNLDDELHLKEPDLRSKTSSPARWSAVRPGAPGQTTVARGAPDDRRRSEPANVAFSQVRALILQGSAMSSPTDIDRLHLARAIELAEGGRGRVSPNPLVGAVIGRHDEVLGEGFHQAIGAPHAEVEAIRAAEGPAIWAARPCTCRSSPAATRAARRRAPTRSGRPGSPGWSSPRTTRASTPPAAASASCATRASRSWSPTASSRSAPGCSTSRFASMPGPAGRGCCSSPR